MPYRTLCNTFLFIVIVSQIIYVYIVFNSTSRKLHVEWIFVATLDRYLKSLSDILCFCLVWYVFVYFFEGFV